MPSLVVIVGMAGLPLRLSFRGDAQRRTRNPEIIGTRFQVRAGHQAYAGIGRYRRSAPTITTTKNRSTMPWMTAKAGPDGGLPGASAVRAGILRKLWITSTKTLR